ncbi:MAG: AbrB/MazE/SpoVT family DNA-binding domain-containing protein [Proteobacteria bacterium]|nr:AbrB/MazE/SpoVT family DNA-binding domain-containing protein [Pseudomonadota bacterium]
MNVLAKLSSKFRITIPKAVRAAPGWKVGQAIAFVPKSEGLLLVPVPTRESLAGLVRGARTGGFRDRHFEGLPGVKFVPKRRT